MLNTKEQLLNIWFNVGSIPGWLSLLEKSKLYNQEDLKVLEEIDEESLSYCADIQESEFSRSKEYHMSLDEFKKELPLDEIKEVRIEFLTTMIEKLTKNLNLIWRDYEDGMEQDVPWFLRKTVLEINDPNRLEKKIRSYAVEKFILEYPEKINSLNRLSPEQIARALEFPFKELIQINKAGFTKCPFHKEEIASFYVKNNWGYCFGCLWHGSTIDFLMARDSLSFRQAVQSLSSI